MIGFDIEPTTTTKYSKWIIVVKPAYNGYLIRICLVSAIKQTSKQPCIFSINVQYQCSCENGTSGMQEVFDFVKLQYNVYEIQNIILRFNVSKHDFVLLTTDI